MANRHYLLGPEPPTVMLRRMGMRVGAVSAACLVASGCTGSTHAATTIAGRGNPCVGPMAAPPGYVLPVTLEREGKPVEVRQVAGPGYTFAFTVTPGSYRLSAPGDAAVSVVVKRGQKTTVTLAAACL